MSEHGHWIQLPLVFLAAAVIVVPLARWLRLGTILGYLVAGVVVGPSVLGVIDDPGTILEVAEFGVVLMMFLVGLELEPQRLWALRRPIFGWGSVQLLGSAALRSAASCSQRSWSVRIASSRSLSSVFSRAISSPST